jgi:hypothetical protein
MDKINEKLALTIGQLMMQIVALQSQNEDLQARVAALTEAQGKDTAK